MTTLHLGVIDVPYADEGVTTGDVAQILEDHYGVMDGYVFLHRDEIADMLAESVSDALETVMQGGPIADPYAGAMSKIQAQFKHYLEREEIVFAQGSQHWGDVPTKAALSGKSKRFKRNSGPRRPSFIDSGLYESSFVAWVTENADR